MKRRTPNFRNLAPPIRVEYLAGFYVRSISRLIDADVSRWVIDVRYCKGGPGVSWVLANLKVQAASIKYH